MSRVFEIVEEDKKRHNGSHIDFKWTEFSQAKQLMEEYKTSKQELAGKIRTFEESLEACKTRLAGIRGKTTRDRLQRAMAEREVNSLQESLLDLEKQYREISDAILSHESNLEYFKSDFTSFTQRLFDNFCDLLHRVHVRNPRVITIEEIREYNSFVRDAMQSIPHMQHVNGSAFQLMVENFLSRSNLAGVEGGHAVVPTNTAFYDSQIINLCNLHHVQLVNETAFITDEEHQGEATWIDPFDAWYEKLRADNPIQESEEEIIPEVQEDLRGLTSRINSLMQESEFNPTVNTGQLLREQSRLQQDALETARMVEADAQLAAALEAESVQAEALQAREEEADIQEALHQATQMAAGARTALATDEDIAALNREASGLGAAMRAISSTVCAICGKETRKMCCNGVYYCGRDCQKMDKAHSKICDKRKIQYETVMEQVGKFTQSVSKAGFISAENLQRLTSIRRTIKKFVPQCMASIPGVKKTVEEQHEIIHTNLFQNILQLTLKRNPWEARAVEFLFSADGASDSLKQAYNSTVPYGMFAQEICVVDEESLPLYTSQYIRLEITEFLLKDLRDKILRHFREQVPQDDSTAYNNEWVVSFIGTCRGSGYTSRSFPDLASLDNDMSNRVKRLMKGLWNFIDRPVSFSELHFSAEDDIVIKKFIAITQTRDLSSAETQELRTYAVGLQTSERMEIIQLLARINAIIEERDTDSHRRMRRITKICMGNAGSNLNHYRISVDIFMEKLFSPQRLFEKLFAQCIMQLYEQSALSSRTIYDKDTLGRLAIQVDLAHRNLWDGRLYVNPLSVFIANLFMQMKDLFRLDQTRGEVSIDLLEEFLEFWPDPFRRIVEQEARSLVRKISP
jgi:hypothetical protein